MAKPGMSFLKIRTQMFFDRPKVLRAVSKAAARAMSRIGGYLRLTARRSIRPRTGSAAPGKPPHSHTGVLRDSIFYSYSRERNSVVVGPTPARGVRDQTPMRAPELLEKGGTAVRKVRDRRTKRTRRQRYSYEARPYMGPALEKARAAEKLAAFWKDVVKG